jgi:hypothetical protein
MPTHTDQQLNCVKADLAPATTGLYMPRVFGFWSNPRAKRQRGKSAPVRPRSMLLVAMLQAVPGREFLQRDAASALYEALPRT